MLVDRTLCLTHSDGDRRDNSPNTLGEAGNGTTLAKISCLKGMPVRGLPLPVR